jgi:spermidine synthase
MTQPQPTWLLLLYGISGFTALAYEVLWMRLVSTLSGASNFGVVVTLIAFMAGLGLGSAAGARWRLSPRQALQLFAACETFAALMSLVFPSIAALLERGFEAMAGSMGVTGWMSFHVIASLLLLMVPATALGMTFPCVLRALAKTDVGVGRIYGLNTLGGVLGALAPLVLLPWLGWSLALRIIAGIGLLVGISAFVYSGRWDAGRPEKTAYAPVIRPAWSELAAYAGIGAAALMLEVGWTRLYGMVFMRTEYVLGVILAVMLLGIAIGSLLARRLGDGLLNRLPLIAALAALMPLALLSGVSSWMESERFSTLAGSLATQGAAMFAMTLLATLALGAWLPLIARRQSDQGAAAWLYGFNSIGAAVGAGVAGWLVLPWLGSTAVVSIAAILLAVCGAYWCTVPRARLLLLLLAPAVVFVWHVPSVAAMLPQEYGDTHDLSRYEDAVSTTQVVARRDGERILLDDLQRVDASTDPTAVAVQKNQGRLPLLLHPDAKSVLFLGLGTGITASVAHQIPGLSAVAVEISPGSIRAAGQWFGRFNGDAPQWLDIRHDDARRFLMADTRHFDVIVGDLFHPDLAGRGLLLSLQQFARVRACLSPSGVYAQWLALNQFDLTSLKIVLATFRQVFPNNMMVLDGFHLAMVGFKGTMPEAAAIKGWAEKHDAALTGGEGWQTWLGRDLGPIPAFASPVQDEWSPVVEFRLAKVRVEGDFDVGPILAWLLQQRPKPRELLAHWQLAKPDTPGVASAALATDAMMHAWEAMFSGRSENVPSFMRLAYEANPRDRWVGFAVADAMANRIRQLQLDGAQAEKAWQRVLSVRPDHVVALRALWHLALTHGDTQRASALFSRLQRLIPLDPEVLAAQHQNQKG